MRSKITFRREISLRSTLVDRSLHTSSSMCLRTGRSGGQDFTYRHLDLSSYVNTRWWNVSEPQITNYATKQIVKNTEKNYLRNVERVPTECLGLLEGHYLDVECPWGELSECNSIVQVTSSVVWVGAGEFCSSCWRQVLDTLVSL